MDGSFTPIRRKDRQTEPFEVLKKAWYGVLSLGADENGYPYGVPVNYFFYDNALWIHSGNEGKKISLIKNGGKACFTIADDVKILEKELSTAYKSVIAFGRIFVIEDLIKNVMLKKFARHFSKDYSAEIDQNMEKYRDKVLLLKFEIDYITGKEHL